MNQDQPRRPTTDPQDQAVMDAFYRGLLNEWRRTDPLGVNNATNEAAHADGDARSTPCNPV